MKEGVNMRVAIIGYGTIGKLIKEELGPECACVIAQQSPDLYLSLFEYRKNDIDVIIDFSNPANLGMIYDYAKAHNTKVVFGTTGYSKEDLKKIKDLSKTNAVLKSRNFSFSANLFNKMIKLITPLLNDDYDIEIVEQTSNKSLNDSTVIATNAFINSLKKATGKKIKYGRKDSSRRDNKEIGFSSIRAGSLNETHSILYASDADSIEIKHTTLSNYTFVDGAIQAARWLINKDNGMYDMEDILFKE